ncbi:MAG: guanylate kinase [Planctomycetia bacterium]|uniref:Guanylate kinase n=1 Tax=Candidatus Brocadia sapporoensis TaxID=392547 RepID=A0A1V6M0H2_9BACT|nr:guanylate kinase [Candidatus Brocadia sapporoensis]MCC7238032.1 guanylate kinase [Candidatus Brocadia sp.]QOJ07052.1 MAG: guanylate kinase [Planctomycetia bacterium]TVL96238.1 MAG: guanylate kinase [Candidatus Brocadia sp. BL1]MDG6006230.1 guanylate kinase [Candidatus Brocadia sp.]OQD45912.1 guanylate kinase [Candidatus Brocadia sapporoensis]
MGKLVIISGPSGSGKTTVCKLLTKDPHIKKSISVTTRLPRDSEKNGEAYYFVSKHEFEEMIQRGELAEHAEYCEHSYGTPMKALKEALVKEGFYLLEIEVQGALQIMEKLPETISIFLLPPDKKTLGQRLIQRNANREEDMENRLKIADKEMEYKDRYNYCVVNDDLAATVSTIRKILNLA